MHACFILLKAIWIHGGSSPRKGKEAWICRQPKWSILCTSSTKTSTCIVYNSWRHASWWKGDLNFLLYFLVLLYLILLLSLVISHLFSCCYCFLECLQRIVLVPPENGYGQKGMNEIPVKNSYRYPFLSPFRLIHFLTQWFLVRENCCFLCFSAVLFWFWVNLL